MGYSDDKTKYGEEAKEWAEHFGAMSGSGVQAV